MKAEDLGLTEDDLTNIIEVLKKFDTINEAVLFGSRAKGNYRRGSDVDIALMGDIDFGTLARVSYLLNQKSLMPYRFDVVNYSRTQHKDLKEHIDRVGISLYDKMMIS